MSLDDIIKNGRKAGPKKAGPTKGGITKKVGVNARKGKFASKKLGNKQRNAGGQQATGATAATKRLVQKLVKKALAQNNNNAGRKNVGNQQQTRIVRQVIQNTQKPFRGVSRRSQIIKKSPRTETVIVRQIVKPRPQPRQQIIREVIVQEPRRQRIISQPVRRFNNNNRPQVVYVEERSSFGGGQPRSSFGQQRSSFGGQQRSQFGGQKRFGGAKFQRQGFVQQRRNTDPFYSPPNFLQR